MPVAERTESILTTELLERCGARAAGYDRDNRFFTEDFEELKAAGYLRLCIPKAFGGAGLNLAEACKEQARLAYRAPATAIAVNMHLYWTGVAADLNRAGDHTLDWLLKDAADGEVFAAGHGERGNDLPVLASSSTAERVEGGYRFTGHKIFGSLSPVWTRLGIHAMDLSDPDVHGGARVHAARDGRCEIKETWDTLGMRATRSDDTILRGAFVPIATSSGWCRPGLREQTCSCSASSRGRNRPSAISTRRSRGEPAILLSPECARRPRWR
jgi:alkylation response protein AidB-like acyl-CoA dehydrogenase